MELTAVIEVGTFTGLPAHPLLNRIAMYLVPTALLVGLLTLWPAWRARLAPWAFGLAVAALVAVQLTMGAGEVMDNVIHRDANPLVEDHESWGKLLRIGLVAQLAATGALLLFTRKGAAPTDSQDTATRTSAARATAAAVAVAAVALVNVGLTVMTAHSGSKSVYERDGQILRGELPVEEARS